MSKVKGKSNKQNSGAIGSKGTKKDVVFTPLVLTNNIDQGVHNLYKLRKINDVPKPTVTSTYILYQSPKLTVLIVNDRANVLKKPDIMSILSGVSGVSNDKLIIVSFNEFNKYLTDYNVISMYTLIGLLGSPEIGCLCYDYELHDEIPVTVQYTNRINDIRYAEININDPIVKILGGKVGQYVSCYRLIKEVIAYREYSIRQIIGQTDGLTSAIDEEDNEDVNEEPEEVDQVVEDVERDDDVEIVDNDNEIDEEEEILNDMSSEEEIDNDLDEDVVSD